MNIFDQYGIKEVADVTLYSIHKQKNGSGEVYYVPALYLDTLKISSAEKTAENVWAEGGKGNARLITWDSSKQINVTLEDALCTPASLSLCWNGILSADWKDAKLDYDTDICCCKNPLTKVSRMEKAFYPRQDKDKGTISALLPKLKEDEIDEVFDLLKYSSVVDGTDIKGFGIVHNHTYKWKIAIESAVKSIAVVPDRFFDIKGRSYKIDQNRKVSVTSLPTYNNYKDAIIYRINTKSSLEPPRAKIIFDDAVEQKIEQEKLQKAKSATHKEDPVDDTVVTYKQNRAITSLFKRYENERAAITHDELGSVKKDVVEYKDICEGDYLAIIVDNEDNYYALIGVTKNRDAFYNDDYDDSDDNNPVKWYQPKVPVDIFQFKGIDMWLRFQSINEMIYFLITKYEGNILNIIPSTIDAQADADTWEKEGEENNKDWAVNKQVTKVEQNEDAESRQAAGRLWCYVNPRTMKPYPDDYWFHQGEPYYIKSITMSLKSRKLKGNKITVRADQWPGMYMMVGETYIRDRSTGLDERMQIKFPLCKVKSDHTLTLEADGQPTTFSLNLEVAKPASGVMMELTSYEVADKMLEGEDGCFYAVDGSTLVLSE